jgi:hypothetical protein
MYDPIKLNLTKAQQKKLLKGFSVRVTKSQIGNGPNVWLHPLNIKKLNSCKSGCNLTMTQGEIMHTANNHGLAGAGVLSDIWSGIKKVGKFAIDSGLATPLADIAKNVATPFVGENIANAGRELLRSTTGVGLKQARIDNMNRARSMKRGRVSVMPSSGGSFRIN